MHGAALLLIALSFSGVAEYSRALVAKKLDQATLDAESFGETKKIKREDSGLRVTIAPGEKETGWKTPQQVKFGGDFTVTASFTIRKLPKPAQEDGAAIGLAIAFQNIDQPEATLVRLIEPNGSDVYRAIEKAANNPNQQMMMMAQPMMMGMGQPGRPAKPPKPPRPTFRASAGDAIRLEIRREGGNVLFQVFEGKSDKPRYLGQAALGTNDVAAVKLFASNRNGAEAVDVVLRELAIRADHINGLGTIVRTVFGDVVYADPTAIENRTLVLGGEPKSPPAAPSKPEEGKAKPGDKPDAQAKPAGEAETKKTDSKPAEKKAAGPEQTGSKKAASPAPAESSPSGKTAEKAAASGSKPAETTNAAGKQGRQESNKSSPDQQGKTASLTLPDDVFAPESSGAKAQAAQPKPKPKEPKARIALAEVESIRFDRSPALAGRFLGQPNVDLTMPGLSAKKDEPKSGGDSGAKAEAKSKDDKKKPDAKPKNEESKKGEAKPKDEKESKKDEPKPKDEKESKKDEAKANDEKETKPGTKPKDTDAKKSDSTTKTETEKKHDAETKDGKAEKTDTKSKDETATKSEAKPADKGDTKPKDGKKEAESKPKDDKKKAEAKAKDDKKKTEAADDVLAPPPGTAAAEKVPKLEPKPNGIRDIHLALANLRPAAIKQVTVNCQTDKGPTAYRLDTTDSKDWPLVVRRSGTAPWADLFLEPPPGDCHQKDFTINITYADGQNGNATVKADEHTDAKRAVDSKTPAPVYLYAWVHLTGDQMLFGRLESLGEESLRLTLPWQDKLEVPLAHVAGLRFAQPEPKESAESFAKRLKTRTSDDQLLARTKDGEVVAIPGIVEGTDGDRLRFRYKEKTRTLRLEQVEGLVIAARPDPKRPEGLSETFSLPNGVVVSGRWQDLDTATWKIETDWGQTIKLPASDVQSVRFRGGEMTYLSDLEPSKVEETPFFGRRLPWKRDVGLLGDPLKIDGQAYERGVAVHSRCVLTYDLDGRYAAFKALVGFDETARKKGRVDCRVVVDGKELYANRDLRADNAPVELSLPLEGARQLRLLVDFGRGEDTGDRLIWANARLYRRAPGSPDETKPTQAPRTGE